jgi:hypothetical protein
MQFVNIDFPASRSEVIKMISNNERVNKNVRFDQRRGKPTVRVQEKANGKIKVYCEMIGGSTRDNGFIQGTTLRGKLVEKNGVTKLKGVITTEPIYHIAFIALIAIFIIQCFRLRGISVVPPILVIFDLFMFKNEFKKQGVIKRYLYRAARRFYENQNA